MIRKIISFCLIFALCLPGLSAFGAQQPHWFPDIDENAWYGRFQQGVVLRACELGLMQGMGDKFAPNESFTLAQALAVASRLNDTNNGGSGEFEQGNPWYQVYVDYAIEMGIIGAYQFNRYDRAATRAEMAHIFASALPPASYPAINNITSLPDVGNTTPYYESIFLLYNAGVLTGNDSLGTFTPYAPVTRAQASAIIVRAAEPERRMIFQPSPNNVGWEGYTPGMTINSASDYSALYISAVANLAPSLEVIMSNAVYEAVSGGTVPPGVEGAVSETGGYDETTGRLTLSFKYSLSHEVFVLLQNPGKALPASERAREYSQKVSLLAALIAPADASPRSTVEAIHDHLARGYTLNASASPRDFTSLLDSSAGSHWAFSELFRLLCAARSIPCEVIAGLASDGAGGYYAHSWNRVIIDKNALYVDTVLDMPRSGGAIGRNYLLITGEQIAKDHT